MQKISGYKSIGNLCYCKNEMKQSFVARISINLCKKLEI